MKEKNISVSVSISRDSNDVVHIRIKDKNSCSEFVDVSMTLEEWALASTGLVTDSNASVRGLDRVGKTRIVEECTTVSGVDSYKREEHEQWLKENCQREGWILNPYLGSQRSITRSSGGERQS